MGPEPEFLTLSIPDVGEVKKHIDDVRLHLDFGAPAPLLNPVCHRVLSLVQTKRATRRTLPIETMSHRRTARAAARRSESAMKTRRKTKAKRSARSSVLVSIAPSLPKLNNKSLLVHVLAMMRSLHLLPQTWTSLPARTHAAQLRLHSSQCNCNRAAEWHA